MAGNKTKTELLKAEQLKYINKSFKVGKNTQSNEIVNILDDYAWTLDTPVSAGSTTSLFNGAKGSNAYATNIKRNTPFCYAVERRSAVNAGIANVINLILTGAEAASTVASAIQKLVDKGGDIAAKFDGFIKDLTNGAADMSALIRKNNLGDSFLFPYKFLYITEETGKKFVFPMLAQSSSFGNVTNTWGGKDSSGGLTGGGQEWAKELNEAMNTISNGITSANYLATLTSNISSFLSNTADDVGIIREMAKTYDYPQKGDDITVNFTLYNTTRLNAWKENYKFLFLFILRNLPLRVNVSSFVPPVLYDIIIPGVKHLPVCHVASINANAEGTLRTLSIENFMGGGNMLVNVPEAWTVSIKFTSLISSSANLVLSGINSALDISTSSSSEK